jgi:hypothetical protein
MLEGRTSSVLSFGRNMRKVALYRRSFHHSDACETNMALAVYESVFFEGRYRYELEGDSLHVVGKAFLHNEVDVTMPLSNLQTRVDRLRVRSKNFFGGLWMITIGVIGYAVLIEGFKFPWHELPVNLVGGIAVSGLGLCLATLRKTEFAQFVNESGMPMLLIAKTRGHAEEFERFVDLLVAQIKLNKSQARA